MSLDLSLYQIESDLADLVAMREEAERELAALSPDSPEIFERAESLRALDSAIREYLNAEVRKVDGIRNYWRHCELMRNAAKEEAEAMMRRAGLWDERLRRLKEMVQTVMAGMPWAPGKPRKLEGATATLILKANGGKDPVEITDESQLPPDVFMYRLSFQFQDWMDIRSAIGGIKDQEVRNRLAHLVNCAKKDVSLALIGDALKRLCPQCNGLAPGRDSQVPGLGPIEVKCSACGGSGLAGIPGARFGVRGEHVELR